jgi:hypothetical protein
MIGSGHDRSEFDRKLAHQIQILEPSKSGRDIGNLKPANEMFALGNWLEG